MGVPVTGKNGQCRGRVWPAGAGARFCDTTQRNSALILVDGPVDSKLVPTHADTVPEPKVRREGSKLTGEGWLWDETSQRSACYAFGNWSHSSVVALKYWYEVIWISWIKVIFRQAGNKWEWTQKQAAARSDRPGAVDSSVKEPTGRSARSCQSLLLLQRHPKGNCCYCHQVAEATSGGKYQSWVRLEHSAFETIVFKSRFKCTTEKLSWAVLEKNFSHSPVSRYLLGWLV